MAYQTLTFVGSNSGTSTNITATGITVDLTSLTGGVGSAAIEGDLVFVSVAVANDVNEDIGVATTGYTQLYDLYGSDSYKTSLVGSWKIMGSTPDTSVTTDTGAAADTGASCIVHVWRGVDQTTPIDVTSTTATGSDTGDVDPPSITPTTTGAVVLVAGASANAGGVSGAFTSYSSLDNFLQNNVNSTLDITSGVGSYAWTSGAYDPAAWVYNNDNTQYSWASGCVALRPAEIVNEVKSINGLSNVG